MENFTLTVEVYDDDDRTYVWFGTESGSGAKYPVNNAKEVGEALTRYIETYNPCDESEEDE